MATPAAPAMPLPGNEPPTDYPGAIWAPAAPGNFDPQNRPKDEVIDMVIVHDIEGPASAGINIFQDPKAGVSAHYVVSADGRVWQMVREHNVGWHAGNRGINHRSVGIETEGYAYRPGWFSPTTYEAEAKLVRDITRRHGIPRDRTHIIGHAEVPHPTDPTKFGGRSGHTDPGPYWNWPAFMTLVRNDARLSKSEIPASIRPGEVLSAAVTFDNTGDDAWPANTAANPKTALKSSGPIVVLGTTLGRISPLSSLQGWISPSLAAGASSDTLPGTSARFEFQIRGPKELGSLGEELRLSTMPATAQGSFPIAFGDRVPVSMRVVPWVLNLATPDAPTAEISASSAPAMAPTSAPMLSPLRPAIAKWTTKLPIGGLWAVYVAPPKVGKARKNEMFAYTMTGAKSRNGVVGANGVTTSAKSGGKGWLFAGHYQFPEPTKAAPTVTIGLENIPTGVSPADAGAVCLVGPFPNLPTEPNNFPMFSFAELPAIVR